MSNGLLWWSSCKESTCQLRAMGSVPGLGGLHMQLSNEACVPQPLNSRPRTWELPLLQPTCSRARAPQHEKLHTATRGPPPLAATRESPQSRKDPAEPEIKKENYFLKVQIPSVQPQESLNLAADSPDCHQATCH